MTSEDEAEVGTPRRHALGAALVVLLPALLLLGGHLLRGERFLPYLPAANEPLATDCPEQAAVAFEGANYVLADRVYPILTDQIAVRRELLEGHLPLWETDVNVGAPLLAGTLAGPLYPLNLLGVLLPPEDAAAPLALLSFVLAGLGLWLFLGRLGLGTGARVAAVLSAELGGWGVTHVFYYMKLDAVLWLPWALWAVEGLALGQRRSGLALALAVAFSLLAGFPTISFFALVALGAYALVRLAPRPGLLGPAPAGSGLHRLLLAGAFLALGVAGGGVQLITTYAASRDARRQEKTVEAVASEAMPPASFLGAFVPDLFGAPTAPTPNGRLPIAWWLTPKERSVQALNANAAEWNTYVGAATLCLALVGLLAFPRRAAFPAATLLLVYGFAQAWPLVRLAYHVPGLNLGAPQRVLGIAWLFWPWLAALGVEGLLRRTPRAFPAFALGGALLLGAAFLSWVSFDARSFATGLEATLVERYPEESLETIRSIVPEEAALEAGERVESSLAHPLAALLALALAGLALFLARPLGEGARARRGAALPVLLVLLLGVLATSLAPPLAVGRGAPAAVLLGLLGLSGAALLLRRAGSPTAWLPLALVLLAEGVQAAAGHLPGFDRELGPVFPPSPGIEAIREAAGDGRVLRLDRSESGTDEVFGLARPNMLQAYGVPDLSTHSIFTNARLLELCRSVDPRMEFRGSGIARLPDLALVDHPVLDLLRVTCLLTRTPVEHPRLELAWERPGFHVYRRKGSLPPARIVPLLRESEPEQAIALLGARGRDPAREGLVEPGATPRAGERPDSPWHPGQIESFTRPSKREVEVRVWGSSGGWLVVHDQYAPGWRATVNGQAVDVLRTDHAFRAVPLPRGDATVRMVYSPDAFRLGAAATLVGLIGAALLACLPPRRRRA